MGLVVDEMEGHMLKEFKEFAIKGSMIDLAIAVIMGSAFGAVVNSLVKDILMPLIGVLLGGKDFANLFWVVKPSGEEFDTLAAAAEAGATTVNYGVFINFVITFLIVGLVIFILVKAMNKMRKEEEAEVTTEECPFCKSEIALGATKCSACTSEL
jgi:large conductance mechanosensitive channel